MKLHRVVDFIDQQAAIGVLQEIDCQHPASDCPGGCHCPRCSRDPSTASHNSDASLDSTGVKIKR